MKESDSLSVVCATTAASLAAHQSPWATLAAAAPHGEWWAGPDWILSWLGAFGAPYTPAVYFVYSRGTLCGAVPLLRSTRTSWGAPRWTFPRNAHVRRIGWLSSIDPAEMLTAVLRHCRREARWSALAMPQIPDDPSWTQPLVAASTAAGLQMHRVGETPSAIASVPHGWEAYVETRDGKFLRALRRHDRRLDAGDGWRIHQYDDTEALVTGWQNLLTIERNSWKHANGTSIANEPGTAPLYEAVARAFAVRSALRLWILFQGDVPVAHALGVVDRQCFFLLKNSFDESYRSQSPGSVLVWRAMRAAVEQGARRIDFLGDATDWKRPLATETPTYSSYTLFPALHAREQWHALLERAVKPPVRRLRALIRQRGKA